MRPEWQSFCKETFKSARSVVLALGVSLVFWLVSVPELEKGQILTSLLICLVYAFTIFGYIWGLYAVAYAVVTYRKIRTGDSLQKLTWSVHIPLTLFATTVGITTAKWFESRIVGKTFSTSGLMNSLMTGSFIAFMFMFYYAYKNSKKENLLLKAAHAKAELHVLKTQMQPHFLFNSLNSLCELIETNKESAAEMAMKLSELYREILQNTKLTVVSLDSEVSIIRKYLELEKMRFGNRLDFSIQVPEPANHILLPPLILQTLVENAVKHGIGASIDSGTITVSVHSNQGSGYLLSVENTGGSWARSAGNCRDTGPDRSTKTGLANTKERLDLLYGQRHGFSMRDDGAIVNTSFWFSGELVDV